MRTTLTSKSQVTIPKKVRESAGLQPGSTVLFEVEPDGRILLSRANVSRENNSTTARFEKMRGKATIPWRTDDLMALLRSDE